MKINLTGAEAKSELLKATPEKAGQVSFTQILSAIGTAIRNLSYPKLTHPNFVLSHVPKAVKFFNESVNDCTENTIFVYTDFALTHLNKENHDPDYYTFNPIPFLVITAFNSYKKNQMTLRLGFRLDDTSDAVYYFPEEKDIKIKLDDTSAFDSNLADLSSRVKTGYIEMSTYGQKIGNSVMGSHRFNTPDDFAKVFTELVFNNTLDSRQTNAFVSSLPKTKPYKLSTTALIELFWNAMIGRAPSSRLKGLEKFSKALPSLFVSSVKPIVTEEIAVTEPVVNAEEIKEEVADASSDSDSSPEQVEEEVAIPATPLSDVPEPKSDLSENLSSSVEPPTEIKTLASTPEPIESIKSLDDIARDPVENVETEVSICMSAIHFETDVCATICESCLEKSKKYPVEKETKV